MHQDAFLKITPDNIEVNELNFEAALRLLMSALLHLMRGALAPSPNDAELKGAIFDSVNQAAANVLERFDPTAATNPDFNIELEIQKENDAINQQLEDLKQTNPRLYRRRMKDFERRKAEQRARILEADFFRKKEASQQ